MDGETILISAFECSSLTLSTPKLIEHYMLVVAERAGLTPIRETLQLFTFPLGFAPYKDKGGIGITGTLVLVESHVGIHTWPEYRFARIELSSCKPLSNPEDLVTFTKMYFQCSSISYKVLGWNV